MPHPRPAPPARPRRRWLFLLPLLALLPAGAALLAAAPQALFVHLPLLLNDYAEGDLPPPPPPGISGVVGDDKAPAAGVPLELRRFDDAGEETAATTMSDSRGIYRFSAAPTLAEDETYYVGYGPNKTDSARVRAWFGPDIVSYSAGTAVAGGDFDLKNAPLLAPADGAAVALPATFAWDQRGVGGDSYEIILYDPASEDAWRTGNLGNTGSLEVTDIPPGAAYGQPYAWTILIYNGTNGYGIAYDEHTVIFRESSAGRRTPTAAPWQRAADFRAARR